jgi:phospholipid/cholesterol/gamma-HCH transport system substrate-binding protein
MRKHLDTEIKVGIFVSGGVVLLMIAIILLGGIDSFFAKQNHYRGHFDNVNGLIIGAKVQLGGIPVGLVEKIGLDKETRNVLVRFSVRREYQESIRKDSSVEIATQGILGDKYLSVNPGSYDKPILPDNSELPYVPSKDLSQFLSKGDKLMFSLNRIAFSLEHILTTFETENRSDTFFKGMAKTASNLSLATQKLNEQIGDLEIKKITTNVGKLTGTITEITEKINTGDGTLGQLLNDSALYDELKALMGGVNRNRLIRNLIRQTLLDKDKPGGKGE